MGTEGHEPSQEDREVHERLALPLLIPAVVFLFAVLVIYGLSRIYLELDTYKVGDVGMATPLAIGVSLIIFLVAAYLASRPRITMLQIGPIFIVAASLLTAGSVWAAVHEEKETEAPSVTETPGGDQTPVPTEGIAVQLIDPAFGVTVDPASTAAGSVTFNVTNTGTIIHNLRVIKTELAPDALPLTSDSFYVDEEQVEVVGSIAEFTSGQPETLTVDLAAGGYVLICNVATHYESGMYTTFTVE